MKTSEEQNLSEYRAALREERQESFKINCLAMELHDLFLRARRAQSLEEPARTVELNMIDQQYAAIAAKLKPAPHPGVVMMQLPPPKMLGAGGTGIPPQFSKFAAELLSNLDLDAPKPDELEALGRAVRACWVEWAKKQPDPKPSWLMPWEQLDDAQKEVDRLIGARVAAVTMRTANLVARQAIDRFLMQLARARQAHAPAPPASANG